MSGDWRERARERVGRRVDARVEEIFAAPPLSSDEMESAIRENQLHAMREVDAEARLTEELTLRLQSPEIPEGLLLPGTADPIVRRLQDFVPSADESKIEFGLVGISAGSTVLHLRPVRRRKTAPSGDQVQGRSDENEHDRAPTLPESEDRLVVGEAGPADAAASSGDEYGSEVDAAMQQLMRLVEAAEQDTEFVAPRRVLAAFEALVQTLDKQELDVDFGWHADTGRVRTGRLTSRGRAVARRRMQHRVTHHDRTLRGYINELTASGDKGVVVIRSSPDRQRGSHRIQISRADMIRNALAFGERVAMLVDVEERVDPLSGKRSRTFAFKQLLERAAH